LDTIRLESDRSHWLVNNKDRVHFDQPPEKCLLSMYKEGDVLHALPGGQESSEVTCPVGVATGAALFPAGSFRERPLEIHVPIRDELQLLPKEPVFEHVPRWRMELESCSQLTVPDERIKELYTQAVCTSILHAPAEVYPGPYTYKRFWFRDAAFILNALISLGARARSRRALDLFPTRQTHAGYFLSQAGEWDSNGEAIWIMHRYCKLTGEPCPERWLKPILHGARWIMHKRLPKTLKEPHAGLLPAGFSAEHLGPNDYYYWDNFWGVAGLRCAADLLGQTHPEQARKFAEAADEYWQTILASYDQIADPRARRAIPASPHRRMDAGAIGSVVADFPLQLVPPGDERMMRTIEFLLEHSSFEGGFFQDMIHSGINAYLTVHLAQVLLRAGDPRALDLVDVVAGLATSTGQWPEAIHPRTKGGCMGDGQHVWAAAEWAMLIRNLFVREEGNRLVIGAGLFPRWLEAGAELYFGPTLTPHGAVSVRLRPEAKRHFSVIVEGQWRGGVRPEVEIQVPGYIARPGNGKETVYWIEPRL
jgi:hypothetical protein